MNIKVYGESFDNSFIVYSYQEKLEKLLHLLGYKIGYDNRYNNVEFYINNNGGEINMGIKNTSVHIEMPFEFSVDIGDKEFNTIFSKFIRDIQNKINSVKSKLGEVR